MVCTALEDAARPNAIHARFRLAGSPSWCIPLTSVSVTVVSATDAPQIPALERSKEPIMTQSTSVDLGSKKSLPVFGRPPAGSTLLQDIDAELKSFEDA